LAEENNAVAGAEDSEAPVATEDNTSTTDADTTDTTTTDSAESAAGTDGAEATGTEEAAAPAEETPAPAPSAPAPRDSRFGLTDSLSSALPSLGGEDQPRKEVPGGRAYEIIYIVRSGNPATVEASTTRVRELIENGEGAVDNARVSEVRRLAYPVKKQTEGIYVVINARFSKDLTEELERYFKLEESVLRHMVLREDEE
jgi:small subunit ribosomal protein S6